MTEMVRVPIGNGQFIQRFKPAGPAHLYRTYGASLPLATHWVPATCEEVDCEPYLKGWSIDAAILSEQDKAVIQNAGYRYIAMDGDGAALWVFEAGQPCFKASTHRREVGKPPIFYRRRGDWRGNPDGGPVTRMRVEDWVDDFATTLDRVQTEIEKG